MRRPIRVSVVERAALDRGDQQGPRIRIERQSDAAKRILAISQDHLAVESSTDLNAGSSTGERAGPKLQRLTAVGILHPSPSRDG